MYNYATASDLLVLVSPYFASFGLKMTLRYGLDTATC